MRSGRVRRFRRCVALTLTLTTVLAGLGAVASTATTPTIASAGSGYRLVHADGSATGFGTSSIPAPSNVSGVVDAAGLPNDDGYWVTDSAGRVAAMGGVSHFGDVSGRSLNQPIVGIAVTPSGRGYWLVASDGGIFSFGDATFLGSTGAIRLNQPIVGMAASPTGLGYWLVARDGGIFTFGDARFLGSTGAIRLNQPIIGMATTTTGRGYWLAASDGGVFTFGDARYLGSAGALALSGPIVAMTPTPSGAGYWLATRDGGVFTYGDATYLGAAHGSSIEDLIASSSSTVTALARPVRTSTTSTTTATTAPSTQTAVQGQPFSATSAWNAPVPSNPALDAKSAAIVTWLSSGVAHPGFANIYRYGVPVWDASTTSAPQPVPCTAPWGTCGLSGQLVPIPSDAYPSSGSDGAMVVIDRAAGKSYEMWQAVKGSTGWTTSWGGVLSLSGDGIATPANAATGAAVSRLAGVVRTTEIAAGRIDHALVFSTDNACTNVYRYPAAKTDGRSSRSDCIPEGARMQLDPTIDVASISGMTSGERAVARALQTYGAYAIDNGGGRMGFVFEMPSGEADPYPSVGFTYDYYAMDRIPWGRLRVLSSWNGS